MMKLERILGADAVAGLAAATAVYGFKPLDGLQNFNTWDDLTRLWQIEAYIRRCILAGALPVRRWPLFGIEPDPLLPVKGSLVDLEDRGLLVTLSDFRKWAKTAEVQAPDTWADAIEGSVYWDDVPMQGTAIVMGKPKQGRPAKLPPDSQIQEDANIMALEFRQKFDRMPHVKQLWGPLASRYGVSEQSVKGRFRLAVCKEYVNSQLSQK